MKFIIFGLLLKLVAGLPHYLIENQIQSEYIVGGHEVQPKYKYPWMVALLYYNETNCGGTLYNSNTLITAAHCMIGNKRDWQASFHRHYINQPITNDNGTNVGIKSWISHPYYNNDTFSFDASVWKLNSKFNNNTMIKLNEKFNFKPGFKLNIIGWGAMSFNGNSSPVLLETQVPIFNLSQCKLNYPSLDITSQFCAGFHNGTVDTCQGDSGGPIFINIKSKIILVGIVSWGQSCAHPEYPGVYTAIAAIQDFIHFYA